MQDWRPFLYGGLASVFAEFVTFPIDTSKTRLQVQGQCMDARLRELKYRGMFHCFTRIAREEGFTSLYSGLAPALLRQATYGTIKIGIYHSLKRAVSPNAQEETLGKNVLCGIVAGVVSSSLANPTDVLKVRMQAKTDGLARLGLARAFVDVARKEGVAGLYRGVSPTASRAAVVVGVELPAYDVIKKTLISRWSFADNTHTHFIASFIAGLLGAIASNPIDVVKTRLMNQRNFRLSTASGSSVTAQARPSIYSGPLHCLVQTYRTEGFLALYKGFIPNWLRLGPWNIVFFITFEKLKQQQFV